MSKYFFIIIANLFIGFQANAQYNFKFIGEGTEKQVKLLWLPEKWFEGMDGVVIKRREVSKSGAKSDWVTLTQTAIHPGNWINKDLSNISNSTQWVSDMQTTRSQFYNNSVAGSTQMKEIQEDYLKTELNTAEATKSLILMFAFDYNMALLMGFGYVDTQYPKCYMLEYGIFPVVKSNMSISAAKTFAYKVGIEPDLSFIVKKNKIKRKNKVVSLRWTIDTKDFRKKDNLVGFNIYRKAGSDDYLKITPAVVWIDKAGDEGSLVFSDTIPDENNAYSYGIAAVSIFKNESKKYEVVYTPQNYIEDITPPVSKCNNDITSDYVSEGVSLEWTFKQEQEKAISGFVIERKLKPEDEFTVVSDTLSAQNRKYQDNKVPAPESEFYIYRVSAVREEMYPIFSNQITLFYNPKKKITRPTNFIAEPKIIDNNIFIHLKWNETPDILKSIQGYTVRCDRAWGIVAREAEIPLIKGFEYDYKVEGVSGTKYLFAIAPVDNDGVMSTGSDTLSIMVPTMQLPNLKIWPIDSNGKKVTFDWKYPNDIPDLAGFRIYQNGVLIADEMIVKANQRNWSSADLEAGKYTYQIEAVTTFKIISKKSEERFATVK